MKSIYWHQKFLSRYIIVGFCLFMLLSLFVVEHFLSQKQQPYFHQKLDASSLTFNAFMNVKQQREKLGIKIDQKVDTMDMGLIGDKSSEITTDPGILTAKKTSVNPNISALFIEWFHEAGLKKGDTVAMAMTGSFPAADIAALSAVKTMGLKPLIILSAGASNYGANIPGFTFVNMYEGLVKGKIFDYRPIAVSLGGSQDRAYGLSKKGILALTQTIKESGFHYLKVQGTNDSIERRMALYKAATNEPISAYINVGGGMASIGLKKLEGTLSRIKPKSLESGVTKTLPIYLTAVNSVAVNFLKQGIPVINLRHVTSTLSENYNFPFNPQALPLIGAGKIFIAPAYNKTLGIGILILDILVLLLLTWLSQKYWITYKRK